jgi:hypothetical protein
MADGIDAPARLLARLDRLPFSPWHRSFLTVAFFGTLFDAADFAIFGAALPAYVLHIFALTYFIAAIAIWMVGIETRGLVLEKITGLVDVGSGSRPA